MRADIQRLVVAVAVSVLVAIVAYANYSHQPAGGMSDFDQVWIAANALRHGADPYAALRATGWPFPLYYPLTAAVVVMPLAFVPIAWARVVFTASGAGLLAWTFGAIPRRNWTFLSGSYLEAFIFAQWSPIMTGSTTLPAFLAGVVFTAKPTIGLALGVAYFLPFSRRTFWAIVGGLTTLTISVILRPSWPGEFINAARHSPHIIAPVTLLPLGPLLLLALLRWRRPEARLIAGLALVPHTIVTYATVPLFLVPRTRNEIFLLVLLADVVYGVSHMFLAPSNLDPASMARTVRATGQVILALLYVPSLIMVLRRPNEVPSVET